MNDNQREIFRIRAAAQDKYVYYLIGISIASIAFGITQTNQAKLSITQIPLGLSGLWWAFSIYCGLRNREYDLSILYSNNELHKIKNGTHPLVKGKSPQDQQEVYEIIHSLTEFNGDKMQNFFNWQRKSFIIGSVLYMIWHIIEMMYR